MYIFWVYISFPWINTQRLSTSPFDDTQFPSPPHGTYFRSTILLQWVINIILIYIIMRYICGGKFSGIVHWPTTIFLFLSCFILKCHRILLFLQILNLFICGIFEHNFLAALKEIHNLWFSINKNKCRNQIPVPQTRRPLKDRALLGVSWSWWSRSWLRYKSPVFR